MRKTGDCCDKLELYLSNCCGEKLIVGTDIVFPECIRCGEATEWSILQPQDNSALRSQPAKDKA